MHATNQHFLDISKELQQKVGRLRYFTKHSPSIGTSHELIIRNFFATYLPRSVSVNTGFIYHPEYGVTKQLDIIIWNSACYSPLFIDGDLVVVRPESAIVVLEVKTKLNKKDLLDALEKMDKVNTLNNNIKHLTWTSIFAFDGNVNSVILNLLNAPKQKNLNTPQQLIVLNKFILDYKLADQGHRMLLKEGKNNFLGPEAFAYFFASMVNWIGRDIPTPPIGVSNPKQLEAIFDFREKYWSKQVLKVGEKKLIVTE